MSEQFQCLTCGELVLPGQADHDHCPPDDHYENWVEYQQKQAESFRKSGIVRKSN